jgi:hypothetical protein
MQVVAFADVDGDREARAAVEATPAAVLAQVRPVRFDGTGGNGPEVGQLHDQERQAGPELRTPARHQPAEQLLVPGRFVGVRLTLVPDGAANAVWTDRRDHGVVERREASNRFPRSTQGPPCGGTGRW